MHLFRGEELVMLTWHAHFARAVLLCSLQLLSSLVDAAERLRQFSPVKESISCAVLEEVRWRLFRMVSILYSCELHS
jgi:hypothetical protein